MPLTSAEKMAALRARQKEADEAQAAEEAIELERERLADQDEGWPWKGLVGEEREQAIRTHYGYTASETRTQAERQAAADRMLAAL